MAVSLARPLVHCQQLDIRGKTHLTPPGFACAEDRPAARPFPVADRQPVAFAQMSETKLHGFTHHHVGEIAQLFRKSDVAAAISDVTQVDAKHLTILEVVKDLEFAIAVIVFERRQFFPELLFQRLLAQPALQFLRIAENGEKVFMLHTQEVLPEKLADSHHGGDIVHDLTGMDASQVVRPIVLGKDLIHQIPELAQSLAGVGGHGEHIGELFDEGAGGPQLVDFLRIGDFSPLGIENPEGILDFRTLSQDGAALDVYFEHGEGVGKGKKKSRCVLGADAKHGFVVGSLVVNLDGDGQEFSLGGLLSLHGFTDPVDDVLANLVQLSGGQSFYQPG